MSCQPTASDDNVHDEIVSGINVTPLVDVALVLLLIFMVTAQIGVSQALAVDLPRESAGQQIQLVFGVQLRANGDILVDGKQLPNDEAVFAIAKEANANEDRYELKAVLRADPAVQHGRVIRVLDLVKQAGITEIAVRFSAAAPQPPQDPQAAPVEVTPGPE